MTFPWVAARLAGAALIAAACATGPRGYGDLMDLDVCSPTGDFTITVDNPFFPLPVGHELVLEGAEGSRDALVRITVPDETEVVAGVETRVVEEYEEIGGRPVEVSRNFFAQATDGTVCYFGEEVDMLDAAGDVTSHQGAWRADDGNTRPGMGAATSVPVGQFDDTVTMVDLDPLGGGRDTRIYARGVGLIVDGPVRLTAWTAGS